MAIEMNISNLERDIKQMQSKLSDLKSDKLVPEYKARLLSLYGSIFTELINSISRVEKEIVHAGCFAHYQHDVIFGNLATVSAWSSGLEDDAELNIAVKVLEDDCSIEIVNYGRSAFDPRLVELPTRLGLVGVSPSKLVEFLKEVVQSDVDPWSKS